MEGCGIGRLRLIAEVITDRMIRVYREHREYSKHFGINLHRIDYRR